MSHQRGFRICYSGPQRLDKPESLHGWLGFRADPARTEVRGSQDGSTDGVVDLDDYAEFAACFTGPGEGLGVGCDVFDFDSDTDVDIYGFAAFRRVFGTLVGVVIDTVTVGNPGNAGELSGAGAGGNGPDRICGAVRQLAGWSKEFLMEVLMAQGV